MCIYIEGEIQKEKIEKTREGRKRDVWDETI